MSVSIGPCILPLLHRFRTLSPLPPSSPLYYAVWCRYNDKDDGNYDGHHGVNDDNNEFARREKKKSDSENDSGHIFELSSDSGVL